MPWIYFLLRVSIGGRAAMLPSGKFASRKIYPESQDGLLVAYSSPVSCPRFNYIEFLYSPGVPAKDEWIGLNFS